MDGHAGRVSIAALTHDLVARRSLVTLVWAAEPDKRITLPVAYGCGLDSVAAEAEKALRAFATEIAAVAVLAGPEG